MFAAGIATGIGLDGHHDDGINDGFGDLGGAYRLVIIDLAAGVSAVGDENENLAATAALKRFGAEEDGVVESRGRSGAEVVEGCVELAFIAGKGQDFGYIGGELVERDGIDWPQQGVSKFPGGGQLKGKILAGAHAGVKGQGDGQRRSRLALED